MSRLTVKRPEEMTPEQREQHARIARFRNPSPDGVIGGPFDPWVRSPELAQRAVSFGNFIWERTTLERRIVEFAICVTARFWESNVEWTAHARAAKQYGVSDASLEAVLALKRPEGGPADEELTYDLCRAMHEAHRLSEAQYQAGIAGFGEQGLVEMMATIGYYTLVAMTLSAFDVQPAEGVARPFAS